MEPLQCSLVETWDTIDQNNSEIQSLVQLVKWEKEPIFPRIGRSAFVLLKQPINIPGVPVSIKSLKLKGIGARKHTGEIIRPTTLEIHNCNPHLGFNKNGDFIPIKSSPAPMGGITIDRAKQEFFVSKSLVENGCPSIIPIHVYQYMDSDMKFSSDQGDPKPLGAVVTGLFENNPLRADSVFDYETLDENTKKEIDAWIQHLNCCNNSHRSLSLIAKLSKLFGKTIRKFSEAGFFRYSGAPDNYSYCKDTGEVFLIDLDSSLRICDLSSTEKSLQVIRDTASGIAYLVAFLTDPKRLRLFPVKEVIEYNPFRELLCGYYEEIDKELVDSISTIIIGYYQKVHLKASTMSPTEACKSSNGNSNNFQEFLCQSFMRLWVDRKETYSYLIPIVWLLHKKSSLMNSFPHQLLIDQVFQNISCYSSSQIANSVRSEIDRFL